MKKILSLVLVLVMLATLVACGSKFEAADADDVAVLTTRIAVLEQKQKDMEEKAALSARIAVLEEKVKELEEKGVPVAYVPAAQTQAAPVEPVAEPAAETAAEPAAETAAEPATETAAEPVASAATSGDLPAVTPGSLAGKAALLTSVGQSADVDVVATLCKKIKLDVYQNSTIKAEELSNKYQVIILAVGGSNKGLGAAGIDADQELARTSALIAKAKELGMTIIAMHTGGADRRGTLSDSFIKPAFAAADIAIIVESGDADHLMYDILAANNTPTAYVTKAADARNMLKELFGL